MSRIGKKHIAIPQDVQVQIEGQRITVKGPKGELSLTLHPDMEVVCENQELSVNPKAGELTKPMRSMWGTERQLIENMVGGVREGYLKKLEIEGVGYKANVEGNILVLTIGFTNPLKLEIPSGIQVKVEKNVITVSGIEKETVGQFSARIRRSKPVEPYKGKGIKYQGEYVRRKLGKRAAATAAGGAGAAK
ncbi:MAG: 50S ribosomal protein L6 [Candidatus Wildermuthbacteria bacterium]|nr:50S ribosomal protein L6 [Candidatus Wildermuthbacteria bacterium]